ncbi:MAG: hypothetical protein A2W95_14745 [Bacteroidetes bacterium GWA2_40_14]|jgi:LacI family transcriptional regulator|nr:MAG: hypothetical protein A2W95_14745 [Bacteroidetes bacterium GWA2_40_14]
MNKSQSKRLGIKDIAAKAGVSIGTVDRVLHNRGEVKEETRQRIMEIIKELEYIPNIFAKSLSSKKTTTIAIVIPDSRDNNPYWEKPVSGIRMAADELTQYHIQILFEHFDASDRSSFKKNLQKVCSKNPDGIVLNPVFKDLTLEFIEEFDKRKIPYVFIDINLSEVNNLAYFGQDAFQSGRVAARLMDLSTPNNPTCLIVKQSKKKIFSSHIEKRIEGFMTYFNDCSPMKNISVITLEIDLDDTDEPAKSLLKVLHHEGMPNAIFVPNSRGFKLAEFIENNQLTPVFTLGYDLIDQNVAFLKKGIITCLLSQKPEEQAYKAIWALFHHLVSKREVKKTNYSAIDIIINENIGYYLENK